MGYPGKHSTGSRLGVRWVTLPYPPTSRPIWPIDLNYGMSTACEDVSPDLAWSGVPSDATSIALIADDPDAPGGTWVHWVTYGLAGDGTGLSEDQPAAETAPNGAKQGTNDFNKLGYGGPCPPKGHGDHRYFFKVYALDAAVDLEPGATKSELLTAINEHILAQGRLMGTYR